MAVKISGSYKKDERAYNGLEAIAKDLIEDPHSEYYIIAKVGAKRITEEVDDGGSQSVTVKLKHIEPMLSSKDEADARKVFERAAKARLGEVPQQTLFEDHDDEGAEDEQDAGEPGDESTDGGA